LYDFHGVRLEVESRSSTVMEALDFRLRGFDESHLTATPGVRIAFEERPDADLLEPRGRPVYETPYGELYYDADRDLLSGVLGGVRLLCEPSAGVATMTAARFAGRALYFATHPILTVTLMELMERHGLFSLHAGCVATAGGDGVILSGTTGAGKSTLTLALVRAGLGFMSDDVVFLRQPPGRCIRVLGFADTVGLTSFAAARFSELNSQVAAEPQTGFPKRLARIEDMFGIAAVQTCTPKAIVFPEVALGEPSSIAVLDPGEALIRLVPDVLLTDAAATSAHVAAISACLDQVSCYTVRSGIDLERAAGLVIATLG
jgi:hypothetical protein